MKIFRKIYCLLEYLRSEKLISIIKPFLAQNERVVDIGAGRCIIAKDLTRKVGSIITPVDIIDYNVTSLPLILYDGERLPFPDNTFDASLLIFVLHHCDDYKQVLKEAMRVSKRIIVVEDIPQVFLGLWFNKCWDWLCDKISPASRNMPYNFKTSGDWKGVFRQAGLNLLFQSKFRVFAHFFGLIKHVIFVLE